MAGAGPIPGRRTAELAGRSPVSKGKEQGMGRESDGPTSMGSSFSDLDGEIARCMLLLEAVTDTFLNRCLRDPIRARRGVAQ